MLTQIVYFPILGKPLLMWTGLITLLFFILTVIAIHIKSRKILSFSHMKLAGITIVLVIIHAILGFLAYL